MEKTAVISDCKQYRFELRRVRSLHFENQSELKGDME